MGFDELLREHAEIHGVVAQVVVWRRSYEGKRIWFRLSAETRTRLLVDTYLGRHVQRKDQGHVGLRNEWGNDWPGHEQEHQCPEKSRLAGGGRNLRGRDQ